MASVRHESRLPCRDNISFQASKEYFNGFRRNSSEVINTTNKINYISGESGTETIKAAGYNRILIMPRYQIDGAVA